VKEGDITVLVKERGNMGSELRTRNSRESESVLILDVIDVRERRILDGEMGLPDGDLSTSDIIEEIENPQENTVSMLASPQKQFKDL
jgi:hypothetical protein